MNVITIGDIFTVGDLVTIEMDVLRRRLLLLLLFLMFLMLGKCFLAFLSYVVAEDEIAERRRDRFGARWRQRLSGVPEWFDLLHHPGIAVRVEGHVGEDVHGPAAAQSELLEQFKAGLHIVLPDAREEDFEAAGGFDGD